MGILKSELRNYQIVPRELVFDKNLSDRARFVYVFMACKPNGWDFYLEPMAKEIGYSVDTLRKYINELVANGWLVKGEQTNEKGVFGAVEYTIKATKFTDTENFRHGKNQAQDNNTIPDTKDTNIKDYKEKRDNNKEKEEDNKLSSKKKNFKKPTIQEISAYVQEMGYLVDALSFFDFYESKGWVVGKSPMKDWKAAVRTWERTRKSRLKQQHSSLPVGMIINETQGERNEKFKNEKGW